MSLLLFLVLLLNTNTVSYAETNEKYALEEKVQSSGLYVGEDRPIVEINGKQIDTSTLPQFDSHEEAVNYIKAVSKMQYRNYVVDGMNRSGVLSVQATTSGNAMVAAYQVGVGAQVRLNVSYTTSGPNHSGKVISHSAYTTFTGLTNGFGWEEKSCSSFVRSNGKDIEATATGELVAYFLVGGFIEYFRDELTLSGVCIAAH